MFHSLEKRSFVFQIKNTSRDTSLAIIAGKMIDLGIQFLKCVLFRILRYP